MCQKIELGPTLIQDDICAICRPAPDDCIVSQRGIGFKLNLAGCFNLCQLIGKSQYNDMESYCPFTIHDQGSGGFRIWVFVINKAITKGFQLC